MKNGEHIIKKASNELNDEDFEFLSHHSYAIYDVFVEFWGRPW